MNWVQVSEIFKLLVCFGDDVGFFIVRWEFRNFGEATMDVDWASHFSCGKEDGPSLVAEAANEKRFCLFRAVLEECAGHTGRRPTSRAKNS